MQIGRRFHGIFHGYDFRAAVSKRRLLAQLPTKKMLGSGQEFMLNVNMRQLRSIYKDENSVASNYLKANIAMITVQNFSIHIDGTVNLGKKRDDRMANQR